MAAVICCQASGSPRRITRQKGIIHLVNAIKYIHPDVQIVLCAGAPDTKEIAAEMEAAVKAEEGGAQVQPDFSITNLLENAIFSLGQNDPASAALHVERALTVASGAGGEVLRNAAAQISGGDTAGALATLTALQEQWPMGDPTSGAAVYSTYCAPCHGAGGYGERIVTGLALNDKALLLAGAVPSAAMALAFEGLAPPRRLLALARHRPRPFLADHPPALVAGAPPPSSDRPG